MKLKVLIPIFFSILIGFLLGKLIFNEYDLNSINTFEEGEKVYFVLLDKTASLDKVNTTENIDNLLYLKENDTYYIYGGITKSEKTAKKIQEFYNNIFNNVNIQEKVITDESFLNILSEYDKITLIATSDNDLIAIEQIVISNYKEMILGT